MTVAWIQFLLNTEESVQDNVFDPWKEQLFNIKIILRKVFVQVLLQVFIVQCVSNLMLRISITLNLKTLVSQVNKIVFILQVVLCTARSKIAMFVEVNTEVISDQSPHSNVELATVEEERMLDVLLHNP